MRVGGGSGATATGWAPTGPLVSAPAVRGVGPGAQQQGDVELSGLVADGEDDLGEQSRLRAECGAARGHQQPGPRAPGHEPELEPGTGALESYGQGRMLPKEVFSFRDPWACRGCQGVHPEQGPVRGRL